MTLDNLEQAIALHKLANENKAQGNDAEAEKLLTRVILIRSRLLGSEHPDTLMSVLDLGDAYARQEKWKATEILYQKALSLSRSALGEEHIITTTALSSLTILYETWAGLVTIEEAGQKPTFANIDAWQIKVNAILENAEGQAKLEKAQVLQQLAIIYIAQQEWEQADILLRGVFSVYESVLGKTHQDTLQCLEQMLALSIHQNKPDDVKTEAKEILARREMQASEADPEQKMIGLLSLAGVHIGQQNFDKAEQLLKRVLLMCELRPELGISVLPAALNALAVIYAAQEKYEQAASLLQKAIMILEEDLGPEHPETQMIREEYQELLKFQSQGVSTR